MRRELHQGESEGIGEFPLFLPGIGTKERTRCSP